MVMDGFISMPAHMNGCIYSSILLMSICIHSMPLLFALKFKKDFVHALKNIDVEIGSQNTRMYDILNRYGLSFKIYSSHAVTDRHQSVDYSQVTPIIDCGNKGFYRFSLL